jgi:ATP-dependent DNA ligase
VQDGRSIMGLPLVERKARLQLLLTPALPFVLFVGDIPEHGEALYQHAVALKLKGIVAKRKDSIYLPGERAPQWFKSKRHGAVPAERFKSVSIDVARTLELCLDPLGKIPTRYQLPCT